MTKELDIRWEQRFSNYNKALKKLTEAIDYIKNRYGVESIADEADAGEIILEEILKEGLIQRFEYTFEMAWNVMKDYGLDQGNPDLGGSRDAIRYAFSINLISEGDLWMDMIQSRIKTTHTCNEETVKEIFLKIINEYHSIFVFFQKVMKEKRSGKQRNLFE